MKCIRHTGIAVNIYVKNTKHHTYLSQISAIQVDIFDLAYDIDFGVFKVIFWNSCILVIAVLVGIKEKGNKSFAYVAMWTCPLTIHTHEFHLNFGGQIYR